MLLRRYVCVYNLGLRGEDNFILVSCIHIKIVYSNAHHRMKNNCTLCAWYTEDRLQLQNSIRIMNLWERILLNLGVYGWNEHTELFWECCWLHSDCDCVHTHLPHTTYSKGTFFRFLRNVKSLKHFKKMSCSLEFSSRAQTSKLGNSWWGTLGSVCRLASNPPSINGHPDAFANREMQMSTQHVWLWIGGLII